MSGFRSRQSNNASNSGNEEQFKRLGALTASADMSGAYWRLKRPPQRRMGSIRADLLSELAPHREELTYSSFREFQLLAHQLGALALLRLEGRARAQCANFCY